MVTRILSHGCLSLVVILFLSFSQQALSEETVAADAFKAVGNGVVSVDGDALLFSSSRDSGHATAKLSNAYTKSVTLRANISRHPEHRYGNWTIQLGNSESDARVGAGYQPGPWEAWIAEYQGTSRGKTDRSGGANAGTTFEFIMNVDLENKKVIAMFGDIERTFSYDIELGSIDTVSLRTFRQGAKLSNITVVGE